MGSEPSFMEYIADQLEPAGGVTYRKMFGEYAVYRGGKVVALVCDNQLFVKPTPGGRQWIGSPAEAPPYPGAKPYFLIEDRLDDREWLSELVRITTEEAPQPKKRNKQERSQSTRRKR